LPARATRQQIDPKNLPTSPPEEATREQLYEAALWVARNTNRIPTLIGPTASGKTYGITELARRNNAEVVTVLLGQHTPDEIAGFQVPVNGELIVKAPFWFAHAQEVLDSGKSVYILFDELGLSREETRGALYTFFRDRHLHGKSLRTGEGAECLVFAASNPAVFAPPFKSRCLFINVPADRQYLLSMTGNGFAKRVAQHANLTVETDPAYSNAPAPPPETFDASALAALNAMDASFWRMDEPVRLTILQGLVPAQTLLEVLKERGLDASALARRPEELAKALRALPKDQMHGMINNVVESLPSLTVDERISALCTILMRVFEDPTAEDMLTYYSTPRSDEVIKAVSDIPAEMFEGKLSEMGMLKIETNRKGDNKVIGTLVDRVNTMVETTKANPTV
jgi:hypothetical protein